MRNRSVKPSLLSRARYSGARAQCSRTNRSGSPTQRRSALPVGAVGIATKTAVRDVGPVGPVGTVGPIRAVRPVGIAGAAVRDVGAVHAVRAVGAVRLIGAVGVAADAIGLVDGVAAPRPGGAALRGGDVVVPEGWVVSAHGGAPSEGPGRVLLRATYHRRRHQASAVLQRGVDVVVDPRGRQQTGSSKARPLVGRHGGMATASGSQALAETTVDFGRLLDARAVSVVFQPLVDLRDGAVLGYEA